MTDDSIDAVLARGRAAEALLDNPALTEALEELAERAMLKWRSSPAMAYPEREVLYAEVQAIDSLRAVLVSRFENAKYEALKLARENDKRAAQQARSTRNFGLNIVR